MDYREKLLTRKTELEAIIQKKREAFRVPMAEMTDELSMYDQHPSDSGSELYEREKDFAYLELLEFELKKTEQALERIEQGLYGICADCGKAIESGRLERLPGTALCIACARQSKENSPGIYQYNYNDSPEAMEFGKTFQTAGYEFYEE
ncbi:MAG TPA: TraR/DksA C4-type zinc finger protein [Syntrophomonadaceae bacterium]|nr:TraR/DksA C4-type zinc finger protein [Syntrophomonadaceae bacterium]HPR93682.1 TraR/DksA C4-type zinc finger protein [Syntrophomonadaceae bacterium]